MSMFSFILEELFSFQSPEWKILPFFVEIKIDTGSGMEWEVLTAFNLKGPSSNISSIFKVLNLILSFLLFYFNFLFKRAIVKGVPQIGHFILFAKYGIAPIWSSCPCVKIIPKNLSPKDLMNS